MAPCPPEFVWLNGRCVTLMEAPPRASIAPWTTIGLVLVVVGLVIAAVLAWDELRQ
jgi:hypothetical protein